MKKVIFLMFFLFFFSGALSAKLLTHFEFENSLEEEKIIAYVLNEDGEFILSSVAKDDANAAFLTISLEADHE